MTSYKKAINIIYILFLLSVHVSAADIDETLAAREQMLSSSFFDVYFEQPVRGRYYTGARFEPLAGVYHGTPYDAPFDDLKNTVNTEYIWFDESMTNDVCNRINTVHETTSKPHSLYAYNWNCAFGDAEKDPADYENYIKNTIDLIASNGMDNIIIFGKEFNIDDNFLHPENYVAFFRYISDYAHTKENIAMCWSPNDTGSLDTSLEDFYPGNEYADWIGMSLYVFKYFQGDPLKTYSGGDVGFIMGDYANPTMRAKVIFDFMRANGIVKPVFITEGAVGFGELPGRPMYENGTEYLDWAKQQTRRYYTEMTRVYPLIKIIVCFNKVYPSDFYRYDIKNEPELSSYISSVISEDGYYIKKYGEYSPLEYVPLHDMKVTNHLKLSAAAYEPRALYLNIRYKMDGATVYETSYPPYEYELDTNLYSPGRHILTVEKSGGMDTVFDSLEYALDISPYDESLIVTDKKVFFNDLRIPAYSHREISDEIYYVKLSDLEYYGWAVKQGRDGSLTVRRKYNDIYSGCDMSEYLALAPGTALQTVSPCDKHIVFEAGGNYSVCTQSLICGGEIFVSCADIYRAAYYDDKISQNGCIYISYK